MTPQVKAAGLGGLLGCVLVVVGTGCVREKSAMPTMPEGLPATVAMVDHGVDLLAGEEDGRPCLALSIAGLARGDRTDMGLYACKDAKDPLVTSLLIADGTQLAVGGAVASSVATVTVNGQPAPRDGRYFLVVLPTIPDNGVTVVASDQDGHVLSSEQHSKALITNPQVPSQTSPPLHPSPGP